MLKSYLLTALRHFNKQRSFALLNLFGLAFGLAICLLITLYVVSEKSYDRQNAFADRIYRVNAHFKISGEALEEKLVPATLGPALKKDHPIIEDYVRLHDVGTINIKHGNEWISESRACWADSSFFRIFTIPLISGNSSTALIEPNTVAVSVSLAFRHFGNIPASEIIGRKLELADGSNYKIKAVFADLPANTHFHFDFIASLSSQISSNEVNWIDNDWITYLLVKQGVTEVQLNRALLNATMIYADPVLVKTLGTSLSDMTRRGDYYQYQTIPLTRIHLYSTLAREIEPSGNITYVRIFIIVAVFILMLASANFINLATARSVRRGREVGIRKVMGADRLQLIAQFLMESMLLSFGATLCAMALAWLALPYFAQLTGLHFTLKSLPWNWLWPTIIGGGLLVGLLAGAYPAFFLSSFRANAVLKGKLTQGKQGKALRNWLTVFQFTVAVALIMGTIVIYNQLSFIRSKKLAFDRSQILLIAHTEILGDHLPAFKRSLLQLSTVSSVSIGSSYPTSNLSLADVWFSDPVRTKTYGPEHWSIDADYLPNMKLILIKGRNFSPGIPSDSQAVIVNETMARLIESQAGSIQKIYKPIDNTTIPYSVVGVVRDFPSVSLHQKVPPLIMTLGIGDQAITAVRLSGDIHTGLEQTRAVFDHFFKGSGIPFQYSFMDDDFNRIYSADRTVGKIFGSFAGLAIIVACLGLFGLVAFSAEQRRKEIGIRHLLGARTRHILILMTKDYALWLVIAMLLAFPVAYWGGKRWLDTFSERIVIGPTIYLMSGFIISAIVMLTIGFQVLQTASSKQLQNVNQA